MVGQGIRNDADPWDAPRDPRLYRIDRDVLFSDRSAYRRYKYSSQIQNMGWQTIQRELKE